MLHDLLSWLQDTFKPQRLGLYLSLFITLVLRKKNNKILLKEKKNNNYSLSENRESSYLLKKKLSLMSHCFQRTPCSDFFSFFFPSFNSGFIFIFLNFRSSCVGLANVIVTKQETFWDAANNNLCKVLEKRNKRIITGVGEGVCRQPSLYLHVYGKRTHL